MRIVVDATVPARVVVNAKGIEGIAQEVRTLLGTRKGSVPLDREFGIDWTVVDAPVMSAIPLYVADVASQIERYVPRVAVESVTFARPQSDAVDGVLRPVVTCKIREEYLDEFV